MAAAGLPTSTEELARKQLPTRYIRFTLPCSACTLYRAKMHIQGGAVGFDTGNGEKLSSSQAEPGQAMKSAVA